MILVTGGTGFIGQSLVRQLVELDFPVRTLIRPSDQSPNLPQGVTVDVAVSSISDLRSLRAAMVGIDTIFHLASAERRGARGNLLDVDIQGTRNILDAARDAKVRKIFYLSHIGADRGSAYPLLKTKAIAEEFIRRSPLEFSIIRSSIVFGNNDRFTTGIARLLSSLPGWILVPGDARTLLQPIWVEDLVTCLIWSFNNSEMVNHTIDVGGPEYLSFNEILSLVMQETRMHRRLLHVPPYFLRSLSVVLESFFPGLPVSNFWLDYLAVNRTTALDTLPRVFSLMPARMSTHLSYLQGVNWRKVNRRTFFKNLE